MFPVAYKPSNVPRGKTFETPIAGSCSEGAGKEENSEAARDCFIDRTAPGGNTDDIRFCESGNVEVLGMLRELALEFVPFLGPLNPVLSTSSLAVDIRELAKDLASRLRARTGSTLFGGLL